MAAKAATTSIGVAVALSAAWLLAGCSMGNVIADSLPAAAGGLPANTPERPAQAAEYPAVHDMPPRREAKPLTGDEQFCLEEDLEAQRLRLTGAKPPPPERGAKASGSKAVSPNTGGSNTSASNTGTPGTGTSGTGTRCSTRTGGKSATGANPSGTGSSRNP